MVRAGGAHDRSLLTGIRHISTGCPRCLAAAGEPTSNRSAGRGHTWAAKTFKVHLSMANNCSTTDRQVPTPPPVDYFTSPDDGDLTALAYDNWSSCSMEQPLARTLQIWLNRSPCLRIPRTLNLLTDPYERPTSPQKTYWMGCMTTSSFEFLPRRGCQGTGKPQGVSASP